MCLKSQRKVRELNFKKTRVPLRGAETDACFPPCSQIVKSGHRRTDSYICHTQKASEEVTRKQRAFNSCTGYSSVLLYKSHLERESKPWKFSQRAFAECMAAQKLGTHLQRDPCVLPCLVKRDINKPCRKRLVNKGWIYFLSKTAIVKHSKTGFGGNMEFGDLRDFWRRNVLQIGWPLV